jgi:hypothetical protein
MSNVSDDKRNAQNLHAAYPPYTGNFEHATDEVENTSKMAVFLDVAPCSLMEEYRRFRD